MNRIWIDCHSGERVTCAIFNRDNNLADNFVESYVCVDSVVKTQGYQSGLGSRQIRDASFECRCARRQAGVKRGGDWTPVIINTDAYVCLNGRLVLRKCRKAGNKETRRESE